MKKSRIIFMSLLITAALVSCSKNEKENFTQLITPAGISTFATANPGGNITCEEVALATGCTFENTSGKIDYYGGTGGTYGPITWTTDGIYVNWTSTVPVKIAIIVKGGNDASVYSSDCRTDCVTSGTALSAPINPKNGKPYGLSNITFCYTVCEEELVVSLKTRLASGTWAGFIKPANSDLLFGYVPFAPGVDNTFYIYGNSTLPIGILVVGNFDADNLLEIKITITTPSTELFDNSYLFVGKLTDWNTNWEAYPYHVDSEPPESEVIFDLPF